MSTKLITGTGLQLLRRYDKKPENYKAQLLDDVKKFTVTFFLVYWNIINDLSLPWNINLMHVSRLF